MTQDFLVSKKSCNFELPQPIPTLRKMESVATNFEIPTLFNIIKIENLNGEYSHRLCFMLSDDFIAIYENYVKKFPSKAGLDILITETVKKALPELDFKKQFILSQSKILISCQKQEIARFGIILDAKLKEMVTNWN